MRPRIEAARMLDELRVAVLASGRLSKGEAQTAYDELQRQADGEGPRRQRRGRLSRDEMKATLGGVVNLRKAPSARRGS